MFFDLDDDALALRSAVRELCGEYFPLETTREWTGASSFDRAAWRELAELGAFTMSQSSERGGLDLGIADVGLVFQVLGAQLVPGPLVAASLAADVDESVGTGESIATVVADPPTPGTGPAVIWHLDLADTVYIIDGDRVSKVAATDIAATPVPNPLDPTTPVWLADTLPAGEQVGGAELARSWRLRGSVLSSALLVGNAERTVELAVTYAKQREQFGRVIGGFQALKHLLADSFVKVEVARAAVDAAAVALDEGPAGVAADPAALVARAVAGARVLAARAATTNAKNAIQVHGGMGFTWETTIHLYLKRAWLLQNAYTTPDEASDVVARSLVLERAS